MERLAKRWQHYLVLGLIYGSGLGVLFFHFWHPLLARNLNAENCGRIGETHVIQLVDLRQPPITVVTKVCDRLVLKNSGQSALIPLWGDTNQHYKYPGFKTKILRQHQEIEVILSVKGNLPLHDDFTEAILLNTETQR